MNFHKAANELRIIARRAGQAADLLDGKGKKPAGRVLSAQARARIGAAQRKRWAKVRKAA